MIGELINRRESAARVTVEVDVTARGVLFPDSVIGRKTGEDKVHVVVCGCRSLSVCCHGIDVEIYIQYFLLSTSRYSAGSCSVILALGPGTLSSLPSLQ